jgi:hypothetical protein
VRDYEEETTSGDGSCTLDLKARNGWAATEPAYSQAFPTSTVEGEIGYEAGGNLELTSRQKEWNEYDEENERFELARYHEEEIDLEARISTCNFGTFIILKDVRNPQPVWDELNKMMQDPNCPFDLQDISEVTGYSGTTEAYTPWFYVKNFPQSALGQQWTNVGFGNDSVFLYGKADGRTTYYL